MYKCAVAGQPPQFSVDAQQLSEWGRTDRLFRAGTLPRRTPIVREPQWLHHCPKLGLDLVHIKHESLLHYPYRVEHIQGFCETYEACSRLVVATVEVGTKEEKTQMVELTNISRH